MLCSSQPRQLDSIISGTSAQSDYYSTYPGLRLRLLIQFELKQWKCETE
jgi:hypothetical protein